MPCFDLGNVQDVVDQQQQVVARRLDRLGMAHLLRCQVAGPIVGQQPRHDQQRIERRAQFVAHIGQELGLVAARLFQFARLFLQRCLRARQVVALLDQLLGLLLQLDIGLLQFGLLGFQPRLRIQQHPALFLQLLVSAAQFLALRLKLLGLLLRFFQQFLQPLAIARRPDRLADPLARSLQQDQCLLVGLLRKADLQHRDDIIVGAGGGDQHGGGRGMAHRRPVAQIGRRHRPDAHDPVFGDRNADQPVVGSGRADDVRALGHADAGDLAIGGAIVHEQHRRLRAQPVGQIAQQILAQRPQTAFARHRPAKADLRALHPLLSPDGELVAHEQIAKPAQQPCGQPPHGAIDLRHGRIHARRRDLIADHHQKRRHHREQRRDDRARRQIG